MNAEKTVFNGSIYISERWSVFLLLPLTGTLVYGYYTKKPIDNFTLFFCKVNGFLVVMDLNIYFGLSTITHIFFFTKNQLIFEYNVQYQLIFIIYMYIKSINKSTNELNNRLMNDKYIIPQLMSNDLWIHQSTYD